MSAVGRSRERGRYRDRGQLKQPILWRVTSAHLDDGNDRAILVQGDEGPAQVVRLGHQGTPSVRCRDDGAILAACPIPSPWRISRAAVSDRALHQQPPREVGSPKVARLIRLPK